MKIGRKGIAPRHPVLKEVFMYDSTMGPLLSHLRAYNSMEIRAIKSAATHAAESVFIHVQDKIKPVGKEASLIEKQRHNDSISWLRVRHIKTINKILASDFGYHS